MLMAPDSGFPGMGAEPSDRLRIHQIVTKISRFTENRRY